MTTTKQILDSNPAWLCSDCFQPRLCNRYLSCTAKAWAVEPEATKLKREEQERAMKAAQYFLDLKQGERTSARLTMLAKDNKLKREQVLAAINDIRAEEYGL